MKTRLCIGNSVIGELRVLMWFVMCNGINGKRDNVCLCDPVF